MRKDKIKKKLKSQQGTSIFFGLLLFLVASILSIVIINGAVTTVKRVASDKKIEQNYLACSSAAKLLQKKIENTTITKTTVITSKGTSNVSTEVTWKNGVEDENSTEVRLEDVLKKYIEKLAGQPEASTETSAVIDWTIAAEKNETETTIPDVHAVCTISERKQDDTSVETVYDISVVLKREDGTNSCQMLLTLKGQHTSITTYGTKGNDETVATTVETYKWSDAKIISGDKDSSVEGN
ncbi:hypothetical protein [Blautia sp.]